MKREDYGFRLEHLLEQYKLYVEMADRISTRRAQTNAFYVSLLSGLFAAFSLIPKKNLSIDTYLFVWIPIGILGLLLCGLWFLNIRSYRQLNSGKFKVIHEMEEFLPFSCYAKEWELLGGGKKFMKYFQLTRIEQWVPIIFSALYAFLLGYAIFKVI